MKQEKRQEIIVCTIQRYWIDYDQDGMKLVKHGKAVTADPILCGMLGGAEACIKEDCRKDSPTCSDQNSRMISSASIKDR